MTDSAAAQATSDSSTYDLSTTLSSGTVNPGDTVSISATVGSPDDSTVLVDLELSDAQGTKVGQQFWDAQAFAAGQTRSYSWDWQVPPTTPAGTYTLKLVIFSPGWGSFVQYFESPAPLQVAASCSNVSLQSLVDAAQAGSVLDVPPCVYRETVYVNKPLTLLGHGQATIKGSDIWNDWTQNGKLYLSSQTVPVFQTHGECATSDNRCLHAEQVYLDGHPLRFVLNGSPSTGQFALDGARHVVLADNPTGHQVEVTTRTAWILGQADGVTVDGFTMADAANDAQTGALSNGRHANWTIQNNNLSAAHGWVVDLSGNGGLQAQNNDISLGGQLGLGSDHATGLVLHANKIHDNNTDGFDTLWEAGGVKMAAENGVVIDNNAFYGNAGPGLWADLGCQKVTFSNNSIYNNQGMGILFEISNQGQIFGNRIWNNATAGADWGWGAGIVVSSSANTEVYQNTLAWNPGGISVISQDRGGGLSVAGIHVHDNTMIVSTQKSSVGSHLRYALEWLQDWNGPLFDPNADNHGTGNAYWFPGPEDDQVRFAWNGPLDHLDDFNNTPGGAHGTYLSDGQKDAILSAQGIPATPASAAEAGASS